jgi:hypothetical protein
MGAAALCGFHTFPLRRMAFPSPGPVPRRLRQSSGSTRALGPGWGGQAVVGLPVGAALHTSQGPQSPGRAQRERSDPLTLGRGRVLAPGPLLFGDRASAASTRMPFALKGKGSPAKPVPQTSPLGPILKIALERQTTGRPSSPGTLSWARLRDLRSRATTAPIPKSLPGGEGEWRVMRPHTSSALRRGSPAG